MTLAPEDNWSDVPQYLTVAAPWKTASAGRPFIVYQAQVDGAEWLIRLNDFPDEPLFTLIVDDREIIHFTEWPSEWAPKPPLPAL